MTIPQEFLKKIGTLVPAKGQDRSVVEHPIFLKCVIDYFRYISGCPLRFHKSIPKDWEIQPEEYNDTEMTRWLLSLNMLLGYVECDTDELYKELEEKEGYLSDQDYILFWERAYNKQRIFHGRPSRMRFFL